MAEIQEIQIETEDIPETAPDIHEVIPEKQTFRKIFPKKAGQVGQSVQKMS